MIDITSPKKDETIRPSWWNPGFLISAYKKIISDNTNMTRDLLSSMEKKLFGNVSGYDISPDMIRLIS